MFPELIFIKPALRKDFGNGAFKKKINNNKLGRNFGLEYLENFGFPFIFVGKDEFSESREVALSSGLFGLQLVDKEVRVDLER